MDQMDQLELVINRDDPDYRYDEVLGKLFTRQKNIQDLYNDKGVVCEIVFDQNDQYTLSIQNKNKIPIHVHHINSGSEYTSLTQETQYPIMLDGLAEMSFELIDDNEISVDDFYVDYRLSGRSKMYQSGCYLR
jgi:hypothetical protein